MPAECLMFDITAPGLWCELNRYAFKKKIYHERATRPMDSLGRYAHEPWDTWHTPESIGRNNFLVSYKFFVSSIFCPKLGIGNLKPIVFVSQWNIRTQDEFFGYRNQRFNFKNVLFRLVYSSWSQYCIIGTNTLCKTAQIHSILFTKYNFASIWVSEFVPTLIVIVIFWKLLQFISQLSISMDKAMDSRSIGRGFHYIIKWDVGSTLSASSTICGPQCIQCYAHVFPDASISR